MTRSNYGANSRFDIMAIKSPRKYISNELTLKNRKFRKIKNMHFQFVRGIFGGGAGYRVQIRTQREKSVSNMDVKKNQKTKCF